MSVIGNSVNLCPHEKVPLPPNSLVATSWPLVCAPLPMPLVQCPECGHSISEGGRSCPKCHHSHVICHHCKKGIRHSEEYFGGGGWSWHERCLLPYFQIPPGLSCPDCKVAFTGSTLTAALPHYPFDCPRCGYPNPLTYSSLCWCGLPVYPFQEVEHSGDRRYHAFHSANANKPVESSEATGCLVVLFVGTTGVAILSYVIG